MWITSYAIRQRIAIAVITCGLIVLGVYGLWRLPVTYLPDITYPLVRVNIWWSGATPEEIDKNIADPVERIMSTVDGVESIESSAIEGMYSLMLNFRYGTKIDVAYQDALAAIGRVTRQLPEDVDPPVVVKADPTQIPVARITVYSEEGDLVALRSWAKNWLDPIVTAIPGVSGIEVLGGLEREIRVLLDAEALIKHGISINTIADVLRSENVESFGGRITQGSREIIARTTGEYRSLDEIRDLVVMQQGHAKVLLRDIAKVVDSHQDVRIFTRVDGKPGLKLNVLKQADANTVNVAKALEARLEEIKPALPKGVTLGIIENQATYVEAAINGVRAAATEAAVLVILVIYLFLGNWRQVAIMLLTLPVTLIINFGLMELGGFSLNIFSLGGLVVAIGVVLDNATVVLENITRLRHSSDLPTGAVVQQGTNEVGSAIVAATCSFLALFLPFLLVPGLTSLLFKELILVIACIVVLSLIVAVSLVPMLSTLFLAGKAAHSSSDTFERFYFRMAESYGELLQQALRHKVLVLACFVLTLIGGGLLLPQLGSEFLPKVDDGRVMVRVKLPTGVSVAATDAVLQEFEHIVAGDPLVETYFVLTGGRAWGPTTSEIAAEGQLDIQLVPRHQRKITTQQYVQQLRKKAGAVPVPGGRAIIAQRRMSGIRSLGDAEIEVKIRGQELAVLGELARKILDRVTGMSTLTNTYISLDMTRPEYQVQVDRVRAAELGISVQAVSSTLRALIDGIVPSQFRDGGEYYDIRLMMPDTSVQNQADIAELPLAAANGSYLRIGDVARVVRAVGPVEITREDQIKQVIVRADTAGISVGDAMKSITGVLQDDLPPGYEIVYGGQAQMMSEMMVSFAMIMAFALFFAFVVLAVQFNSLKLPLLVLLSVPFCLVGVVYTLYMSALPVGATVIIGALIVVSSTVNEGVLLITYAEDLRRHSRMGPVQAILHAARLRLRPRLMIAVTVIAGLIPLALNLEEGGDMLQPMAIGGIGGLVFGIAVALFMVPCMYVLMTPNRAEADSESLS